MNRSDDVRECLWETIRDALLLFSVAGAGTILVCLLLWVAT